MHNRGTVVVVSVMAVDIAGVVVVGIRVVTVVFTRLMMVVVMVTAPERLALVVALALRVVTFSMELMVLVLAMVVSGIMRLAILSGPVGRRVHISVIHHVFVLSSVSINVRVVAVMTLVTIRLQIFHVTLEDLNLDWAVNMVDDLVLSMLALTGMLVSPEKLLVGWKGCVMDWGVQIVLG